MITIELSSASYPSYSELIESLVDYDYHHVGMVMEPGEYAVRGSIIDVFPSNHSHPVRFDYFGNDLDRLTVFDVASQQSLRELSQTQIKKRTRSSSVNAVTSLTDAVGRVTSQFNYGDLVVHEQFGIGQFSGLKRLCIDGQEGEYVFLKYRGEDRLYVPLHNLNRLHPFSKNDELTQLSQLHDGSWEKAKAKVEKATEKLAEEIFELYKKRAHVVGFQYGEDTEDQLVLESGFEHPLTPDQERAVREIKADMETPRPMDRLLCGDVGYGKTEVLLRAAFKALENYKQIGRAHV